MDFSIVKFELALEKLKGVQNAWKSNPVLNTICNGVVKQTAYLFRRWQSLSVYLHIRWLRSVNTQPGDTPFQATSCNARSA